MSPRPYQLGQRQAESCQTRSRVLHAARALLMESTSFSSFSIEAVARRADVARMTIYHQFVCRLAHAVLSLEKKA
ncbi:MAG TPA: TetR family transcriptional regulator [Ktedonobacteraceae bacterium]